MKTPPLPSPFPLETKDDKCDIEWQLEKRSHIATMFQGGMQAHDAGLVQKSCDSHPHPHLRHRRPKSWDGWVPLHVKYREGL